MDLAPRSSVVNQPAFGWMILPAGTYTLVAPQGMTYTLEKIEVTVFKSDGMGGWNAYPGPNEEWRLATVQGNDYSAASYLSVPGGIYKVTHRMKYFEIVPNPVGGVLVYPKTYIEDDPNLFVIPG